MLKREGSQSSKFTIQHKCGECLHFDKIAKFPKLCSKNGVMRNADAPSSCFTPNYFLLQDLSPDTLNQLGLLMRNFTPRQSRVMISLLRNKKQFDKYGLAFGMPVYVALGSDYLSNYYRAFVISVSTHGDPCVFVSSDLGEKQLSSPCIMSLLPDSVFTVTQFVKKKADLIRRNRIKDPSPNTVWAKKAAKKANEEYEPPTMDTVPASWFDSFAKRSTETLKIKKVKGGLEFKVRD